MSAPIPQVVTPSNGYHNADLACASARLFRGNTYRDCSTIMVIPAIKPIPPKVYLSHKGMMAPMNQKFTTIMLENMEVGDAYEKAISIILDNPELRKWKYVLTVETDNIMPPDGLLKLIEDIESGPYDAVGALYWTKGEGGQPMCYGDPSVMPKNFIPFCPPQNTVTPCNGLGMGFTLFRLSHLAKMPEPRFKTVQEWRPTVGVSAFTQDLWHFQEGAKYGGRYACSTRVLVGHYDYETDICW